jgi:hypothetical protein
LDNFPNAKFIHILRDPLTNMASLKRYTSYRYKNFELLRKCRTIKKSFKQAKSNKIKYGEERYKIVLYEDLIANTHEVMNNISDFLNINFENSLTIPTENKKPGVANSMYEDSRLKGKVHDQSTNLKWKKELTEIEKKIIVSFLSKNSIGMGYDNWKTNAIKKHHVFSLLK